MDALLRRSERRARLEPGDGAGLLAHARSLARAGLAQEAVRAVLSHMGSRRLETAGLTFLRDLAEGAGHGHRSRADLGQAHVDVVVRRSLARTTESVEIAPSLAFLGPPASETTQTLTKLLDLFEVGSLAPRSCEVVRSFVAWGERVLDVRVPLREPWRITPDYRVRTLRLLGLPGAPEASSLRRKLLRSVSALAITQPEGREGDVDALLERLSSELSLATGHGLAEFPLLLLYRSPADARRHGQRAIGADAAWAIHPEDRGATALATLLLDLRQGVRRLARRRSVRVCENEAARTAIPRYPHS